MNYRARPINFVGSFLLVSAIAIVIQACGAAKNNSTNPNNRGSTPPAADPSKIASQTLVGSPTDLNLSILKDKLQVKLVSANKELAADGSVTATVDLRINDIDVPVKLTNTPDGNSNGAPTKADASVPKLNYKISALGYFDFKNPQNYYLILKLTLNGQDSIEATQQFAIVIGDDPKLKQGFLFPDNPGKDSLDATGKGGFYQMLVETFKPKVSTQSGEPNIPTNKLTFSIGSDSMEIKITSADLSAVSNSRVTATLVLSINGNDVTITDADHAVDATNSNFITSVSLNPKMAYSLAVEGNIDTASPIGYFMALTLVKDGADSNDPNSVRDFAAAFGKGNTNLASGVLLLNLPRPGAASNSSVFKILKDKFPLNGDSGASSSANSSIGIQSSGQNSIPSGAANTQTSSSETSSSATSSSAGSALVSPDRAAALLALSKAANSGGSQSAPSNNPAQPGLVPQAAPAGSGNPNMGASPYATVNQQPVGSAAVEVSPKSIAQQRPAAAAAAAVDQQGADNIPAKEPALDLSASSSSSSSVQSASPVSATAASSSAKATPPKKTFWGTIKGWFTGSKSSSSSGVSSSSSSSSSPDAYDPSAGLLYTD